MDEVQIGRVVKPHGVRGEVVVEPTTDDPKGRFAPGEVLVGRQTGKTMELTVTAARGHQGRLLLSFEEVLSRNDAESLRGMRFFAQPQCDEDDAYYDDELIGLTVLNCGAVSGEEAQARAYEGQEPEPVDIGKVVDVHRNPAHRLLEVQVGNTTALIPFVHSIVPIVDLDNEAIVITPPDGLID